MTTRWQPKMTYRDHMKARMCREAEAVSERYSMNELEYLVISLRRIVASKKAGMPMRLVEFEVERGRLEQIGSGKRN